MMFRGAGQMGSDPVMYPDLRGTPMVPTQPSGAATPGGMFGDLPFSPSVATRVDAATRRPMFGAPMMGDMPSAPAQVPRKPGFNDPGGLADSLHSMAGRMMMMGGLPDAGRSLLDDVQQRNAAWARLQQQQGQWEHDARVKADDRAYEANKPEYFTAGRDRVRFDPATQQATPIYSAPSDAESYAQTLGLQPGTPDYNTAVQDYVLRGSGPTAYGFDVGLENERQGNRVSLEGLRQGNRLNLRSQPTWANLHPRGGGGRGGGSGRNPTMAGTMAPILAKVARGQALSAGEQQAWSMYKSGRGGKGGAGGNSAGILKVAQDGNGNKVGWNGSKWVPIP